MSARQIKQRNERNDTLAIVYASTILGSFLSLMAGVVPLAVIITTAGVFTATRLMVKAG